MCPIGDRYGLSPGALPCSCCSVGHIDVVPEKHVAAGKVTAPLGGRAAPHDGEGRMAMTLGMENLSHVLQPLRLICKITRMRTCGGHRMKMDGQVAGTEHAPSGESRLCGFLTPSYSFRAPHLLLPKGLFSPRHTHTPIYLQLQLPTCLL